MRGRLCHGRLCPRQRSGRPAQLTWPQPPCLCITSLHLCHTIRLQGCSAAVPRAMSSRRWYLAGVLAFVCTALVRPAATQCDDPGEAVLPPGCWTRVPGSDVKPSARGTPEVGGQLGRGRHQPSAMHLQPCAPPGVGLQLPQALASRVGLQIRPVTCLALKRGSGGANVRPLMTQPAATDALVIALSRRWQKEPARGELRRRGTPRIPPNWPQTGPAGPIWYTGGGWQGESGRGGRPPGRPAQLHDCF